MLVMSVCARHFCLSLVLFGCALGRSAVLYRARVPVLYNNATRGLGVPSRRICGPVWKARSRPQRPAKNDDGLGPAPL